MDVGSFRPLCKGEGDYVIFLHLKGLFSAFEELKTKVISSQKSLEENSDNDFLGRLLLGAGSALMFVVIMAINSRDKIKRMLTSIAN